MCCKNLSNCQFYQSKIDAESGMGKQRYCLGDNSKCARYITASKIGRENVPANLYPNMHERAKEIIKKHS